MDYQSFLESKKERHKKSGFDCDFDFSSHLFPHQVDVVDYLLRIGSGAAFLDTGLGKTACELEWARIILKKTNNPILYLAPLAVGNQHIREAERFQVNDVKLIREPSEIKGASIYVTNYERLHKFDSSKFGACILDESSIIKSFAGVTTKKLMEFCKNIPFKLAATATPAPNDHMEIGQHSQFLGVMDSPEMLARWFIADQTKMGKYRLKHHGVNDFWSWVASWSRCIGKPSDLGYSDEGYNLPQLKEILHTVKTDITKDSGDALFRMPDTSATAIHKEKRLTAIDRAKKVADLIANDPDEFWMVWSETDYDCDAVRECVPDIVEVHGRMKPEQKEELLDGFSKGEIKYLLSKPKIAGMGLNWQHCARTAFVGLSFSYEMYYQAIRRFYRFGQKREVQAHICLADTEQSIWSTIIRKKEDHEIMKRAMFDAMKREVLKKGVKNSYNPQIKTILPEFLK